MRRYVRMSLPAKMVATAKRYKSGAWEVVEADDAPGQWLKSLVS